MNIISAAIFHFQLRVVFGGQATIPVGANGFNIVVFDRFLNKVVNIANFNTNDLMQRAIKPALTEERFGQGTLAYRLDISKPIADLEGASGSEVIKEGIRIDANSIDPRFYLNDFVPKKTHVGIKAEIECPVATIFEAMFNGSTARAQLVKGYNTVYLEIEAPYAGGYLRIDLACIEGEYILNSLEIVYLY